MFSDVAEVTVGLLADISVMAVTSLAIKKRVISGSLESVCLQRAFYREAVTEIPGNEGDDTLRYAVTT